MGRVAVRVQPRAARGELAGEREGRVVVRVSAPPVGGKANDAVRKLVAKRLGVPPSRVSVVRGHSSRDKLIEVAGVGDAVLRRELGGG